MTNKIIYRVVINIPIMGEHVVAEFDSYEEADDFCLAYQSPTASVLLQIQKLYRVSPVSAEKSKGEKSGLEKEDAND